MECVVCYCEREVKDMCGNGHNICKKCFMRCKKCPMCRKVYVEPIG